MELQHRALRLSNISVWEMLCVNFSHILIIKCHNNMKFKHLTVCSTPHSHPRTDESAERWLGAETINKKCLTHRCSLLLTAHHVSKTTLWVNNRETAIYLWWRCSPAAWWMVMSWPTWSHRISLSVSVPLLSIVVMSSSYLVVSNSQSLYCQPEILCLGLFITR